MAEHQTATLIMSESITHDLKRCINSRPAGFAVAPDQGVERTSNQVRRANGPRLFTPTSLDDDSGPESTFKRYPKHEELTATLHHLTPGAESLVCEPSAAIHYRDPALFVAGAAGITPSMAVLRDRARQDGRTQQSLRFSNKPPVDMVCEKELRQHPGNRGIFTYTATKAAGYARIPASTKISS